MLNFKAAIAALALLLAQSGAMAGSVDGPYIVWVNLAANPASVNQELAADLKTSECWQNGGVLFGSNRPKKITPELVKKAIVERDKPAIKRLNELLGQPSEVIGGARFDGIVVYSDQPKPTLYSMTVGLDKIRFAYIAPQYLGIKFCKIAPPITRSP